MNSKNNLYKKLTIKSIKEEVPGFKTFSFAENFIYKAGQYITLVHTIKNEETRRSYSITSSPALNEALTIGVKRIENGFFSRKLIDTVKIDDEVITIGAGGLFVLPENINNFKQIFFFAAGSGITPIYSLIKTLLHQHKFINVVLIYSNASIENTAFYNELNLLQNEFNERFKNEFLFSNILHLSKARLHRNLLLQFVDEFSVADFSKILFYICGPVTYMRMCTFVLQEYGIPPFNIKKEDFVIDAVHKRDALPPDKHPRKAFIHFNNVEFEVMVNYPDSILQSAKKQNIVLPYSCEAGRCGSCIAKCTKGKVWHSYNEVLTEKELKQGLILTCVAHPINGDVELEIKTN